MVYRHTMVQVLQLLHMSKPEHFCLCRYQLVALDLCLVVVLLQYKQISTSKFHCVFGVFKGTHTISKKIGIRPEPKSENT